MFPPQIDNVSAVHAAPLFAALGDITRLRLVDQLSREGPQSIKQLTSDMTISRQAITKHLLILASAGLVHDERRGRERLWTVEEKRLLDARSYLEQIAQQWDDAIARLRQIVEQKETPSSEVPPQRNSRDTI